MLVKAQMEEVALPYKKTSSAPAAAAGSAGAAGGRRSSRGSGGAAGGRGRAGKGTDAMDVDGDEEGEGEGAGMRLGVFSQSSASGSQEDGASPSTASDSTGTAAFGGSDTAAVQRDARRSERVDFSKLDRDPEDVSPDRVADVERQYDAAIHALQTELAKMSPNLKAAATLADVERRCEEAGAEHEAARGRHVAAVRAFDVVKTKRRALLTNAFNHVRGAIDRVYKDLTVSSTHAMGGKAALYLEANDEGDPFDEERGGVRFSAMPPTKRFREMEQLSGGEKTVAALALIFALHSYKPSPFFVMDEIDAALDNVNVHKVASYIRRRATGYVAPGQEGGTASGGASEDDDDDGTARSNGRRGSASKTPEKGSSRSGKADGRGDMQCLVISLKDAFYEKASGLIGVYRDAASDCSRNLTMDLTQYAEAAPSAPASASRFGATVSAVTPGIGAGSALKSASTGAAGGAGRRRGEEDA
jgi:hypothetical protein